MTASNVRESPSRNGCSRPSACRPPAVIGACAIGLVLALAPAVIAADVAEKPRAEPRCRDIVLKRLPEGAQIIGLEFTVVHLDDEGNRKAIDMPPEEYPFKVGDRFLVNIKPQDDLYIYVFTEGPEGRRAKLLPESNVPVHVKAGQEITLPIVNDFFEFKPPAGEEKLLVIALREHNPDIVLVEEAAFKKAQKLNTNPIDALKDRIDKGVRSRGPSPRQFVKPLEAMPANGNRGQFEMTPDKEVPHTEVVAVNAPEIVVGISLKSKAKAIKAP